MCGGRPGFAGVRACARSGRPGFAGVRVHGGQLGLAVARACSVRLGLATLLCDVRPVPASLHRGHPALATAYVYSNCHALTSKPCLNMLSVHSISYFCKLQMGALKTHQTQSIKRKAPSAKLYTHYIRQTLNANPFVKYGSFDIRKTKYPTKVALLHPFFCEYYKNSN